MSLADELLNDFDDGEEDEETLHNEHETKNGIKQEPMETDDRDFKVPFPVNAKVELTCVRQVAKLWDSHKLKEIKEQIEAFALSNRTAKDLKVPVETDPEYKLIVEANNIFADIDNEIGIIHKFVKDKYSKRFPELESLVVNPLEYLNAVRELGNDVDKIKSSDKLSEILTQATIMVVSVTASTTQGTLLSKIELSSIEDACNMAQELNAFKLRIFEYVESRMNFIAPNLSIVVGASTAAKLMGAAGGLTNLAKMPADYIMLVGKQRKAQMGMSQSSMLPHTGFIYYCDIIQETPPDLKMKAARLVSAKAALASRVDSMHGSPDGEQGQLFREDVEKKLDKLQEPPPVKAIKPLPIPIDTPGKKRGGRRVRKMKERMAITDLRKAQNRQVYIQYIVD